jgi:hypothetical protein
MFGFNGKAVCLMTKSMFQYRVPKGKGALILYTVRQHFYLHSDKMFDFDRQEVHTVKKLA